MNALKRWEKRKTMEAWQNMLGGLVNHPLMHLPEGKKCLWFVRRRRHSMLSHPDCEPRLAKSLPGRLSAR